MQVSRSNINATEMNYVNEIVTGLVGLVAGGGTAFATMRTSKADYTEKLLAGWERQNHNCEERLIRMEQRLEAVEKNATEERARMSMEVANLRAHIVKLEKIK